MYFINPKTWNLKATRQCRSLMCYLYYNSSAVHATKVIERCILSDIFSSYTISVALPLVTLVDNLDHQRALEYKVTAGQAGQLVPWASNQSTHNLCK